MSDLSPTDLSYWNPIWIIFCVFIGLLILVLPKINKFSLPIRGEVMFLIFLLGILLICFTSGGAGLFGGCLCSLSLPSVFIFVFDEVEMILTDSSKNKNVFVVGRFMALAVTVYLILLFGSLFTVAYE